MNKGIIMAGIIILILVGGGYIANQQSKNAEQEKMTQEKAAMKAKEDAAMKEKEAMKKDKEKDGGKDEAMMGKGFLMKDGKMMVEENGKMTVMTADATINDGTKVTTSGQVMKKDGTTMILTGGQSIWMDGTMMKGSYTGKQLAGKSSPYIEYNKADYEKAKADGKIIFLDFYANWCPICRAEAPEFNAAFNSLTTDKVVGFRVNYQDSDTDKDEKKLAGDFGITHQNSKIILKDGKEVIRTLEQWDKATFLQQINAALQ